MKKLIFTYLEMAEELFIFPEKCELYAMDKYVSQGTVKNQALMDKMNEKIKNILQKFR